MTTVDSIVTAALALRVSHPQAPAIDTVDVVLQGVDVADIDFGGHGVPPAPFALLVAEAFDSAMTPAEWGAFTSPTADPTLRAAVLAVWAGEVWPRFAEHYC